MTARLAEASKGLWYLSETDAEITPFRGRETASVSRDNLLPQVGKAPATPVEERDFKEFFARLTAEQDWFGDEEKETARRFADLRDILTANLRDLRVFKVGKIELEVYVVGLDEKGVLTGVQTKAVET